MGRKKAISNVLIILITVILSLFGSLFFLNDNSRYSAGEWVDKGIDLYYHASYKNAINNFDKAVKVDPDYTDAYAWRGFTLIKLNRYQDALFDFEKTISLDPENPAGHQWMGYTLYKLENYDDALNELNIAIDLEPDDAISWNWKGKTLEKLGRHIEALESFEYAVSLDPSNMDAKENRDYSLTLQNSGSVEISDTKIPENVVLTDEISYEHNNDHNPVGEVTPIFPTENQVLGHEDISNIQQEYPVTNIQKTKSHNIKSESPSFLGIFGAFFFNIFGTTLKTLGLQDLAISAYDSALNMDPNNDWALTSKGDILYSQGKYEESANMYDQALAGLPEESQVSKMIKEKQEFIQNNYLKKEKDTFSQKSNSITDSERENHSRNFEGETINANDNPEIGIRPVNYNYGNSQESYHHNIDISDYELKKNPNNVNALCQKGDALFHLGNYNEAIQSYNEALRINPENLIGWYQKACCLDNLGRHEEAIELFDFTLKIYPNNVDALCKKGDALYKLRNYNEAAIIYNQALRISPNSYSAQEGRDRALYKNFLGKPNL